MMAVAVINSYYSANVVLILGWLMLFIFGGSDSRNIHEHEKSETSTTSIQRRTASAVRFVATKDESHDFNADFIHPTSSVSVKNPAQISQSIEERLRQLASVSSDECPPPAIGSKPGLCQAKLCAINSDCREGQSGKNVTRSDSLVCCYNGCVMTCAHRVDAPLAFDWVEETEFKSQQPRTTSASTTKMAMNDNDRYPNLHPPLLPHQSLTSSSSSSEDVGDDDEHEYEDENGGGGGGLLTSTHHGTSSVNHDHDKHDKQLSTTNTAGVFTKHLQTQSSSPSRHLLGPKSFMSSKAASEAVVLPGGCLLRRKQYQDLVLFRRNNHVTSW